MSPPLIPNPLSQRTSNTLSPANTSGVSNATVNQVNANSLQPASQDASVLQEFQPSALTRPRLPASMAAKEKPASPESQDAGGIEEPLSSLEQHIKDLDNAPAETLNSSQIKIAKERIEELTKQMDDMVLQGLDDAVIKKTKNTGKPSTGDRVEFRRTDNRQRIDLDQLADRHELAKKVGVNAAKRTFAQKLGGAIVVGLVGLALTTAAVITGGAGLAIAAGMTAAIALRLGADSRYAKMAVKNAEAQAAGLPPPHDLPMGTDSVANLFFKACPSSWSEKTRKQIARVGSFGTDAALQGLSGLLGGGVIMLPMVSVGIILVGITHAVRAMRNDTPDLEKSVRDAVQKTAEDASNAVESAFKVKPKDTLEGVMQDAASELERHKEEVLKLGPSLEKEALTKAIQAKEDQLDGQIEKLAQLIETLPFEASLNDPSKLKETSKTMGIGIGMVGFDFAVKTSVAALGVQGLDFASSAIDLGMMLTEMHNNNNQLQTSRDFLVQTDTDFAAIRQRQLNEKFMQQPGLDEFDFEMTIEESMTQMQDFIRV